MKTRVVLSRRARHAAPRWGPLKAVLQRILADHGARGTLSIALVSDRVIAGIHEKFLGIAGPTDVLSFPLAGSHARTSSGGSPMAHDDVLGEVVVSVESARREAMEREIEPGDEAALYAIHGTLHLVGFDDHDPRRRRAMRGAERKYLDAFRRLLRAPRSRARAAPRRDLRP